MAPAYPGPRPCVSCDEQRAGCAWTCSKTEAHSRQVSSYLLAMSTAPLDVVTVGFCVDRPAGSPLSGCRSLYVKRAFSWDLPLLLAEMQAECDRLAGVGFAVLVAPREMRSVSDEVDDALRAQWCRGINGVAHEVDREKLAAALEAA